MKTFIFLAITMFFMSLPTLRAQNNTTKGAKVTGVVLDENKFPIVHAPIFIDSLKTGLRTNKKGIYKVRVLSDTRFISIWSKEHGFKSLDYDNEKSLNFDFSGAEKQMAESDLIALGYVLNPEIYRQIGKKSYSKYVSILQLIKEEFSGVIVRSDGSIQVRGSAQLTGGSAQPLFIVDGNYLNDLGAINPAEVKSIELLKGEDTALYGARGANGVFIIELLK